MAQTKLLKISSDGVPIEMDIANDDITLKSYTVTGGGPVLSGTGLNMNDTSVSAISTLVVSDPTTGTINQTAGALVIDNIMAKDRSNVMTTASDILFPTVTNTSGQLDAFRLPTIAGAPTATPTAAGEGFIVWDSVNDDPYVWNGTAWDNLNLVKAAEHIADYYTAGVTLTARQVVYISSADTVSLAVATAPVSSQVVGLSNTAAASAAQVEVMKTGRMTGFTALTPGSRYYLDTATAGGITPTLPTASGSTIVQIGYAKNATSLDIMIQPMGRRA